MKKGILLVFSALCFSLTACTAMEVTGEPGIAAGEIRVTESAQNTTKKTEPQKAIERIKVMRNVESVEEDMRKESTGMEARLAKRRGREESPVSENEEVHVGDEPCEEKVDWKGVFEDTSTVEESSMFGDIPMIEDIQTAVDSSAVEDTSTAEDNSTAEDTECSNNYYMLDGDYVPVKDPAELEAGFLAEMEGIGYTNIQIFDPDELNIDSLRNRIGTETTIVQRCIGVVSNREHDGAGKILNIGNTEYDYIDYSGIEEYICEGTIILTYLVFNPETNFEDDIVERFDYILDREYED